MFMCVQCSIFSTIANAKHHVCTRWRLTEELHASMPQMFFKPPCVWLKCWLQCVVPSVHLLTGGAADPVNPVQWKHWGTEALKGLRSDSKCSQVWPLCLLCHWLDFLRELEPFSFEKSTTHIPQMFSFCWQHNVVISAKIKHCHVRSHRSFV